MPDHAGAGMDRPHVVIRTPDQRLRVFISSTLKELSGEREAARRAVSALRLTPVMFELSARPHPASTLYRAYLAQSHVFIGIYWQSYGWVAPGAEISGLEDEYLLAGKMPKLIYIKTPAPEREPGLAALLQRIKTDDVSYKYFSTPDELEELIGDDLAVLLTERFEQSGLRPALRTDAVVEAAGPRPNLPQPLTPLVGREGEVDAVRAIFARPDVRLVTLTGPGGVGKTRLSLEVADRLADSFEHGVYWVNLAPIREPDLVISAIARVLDVRERGGTQLLDSLKDYLRSRNLLLLLDNFEQVLLAGPLVAELLAVSPEVKFLVTSRAPLRLRGEQEYPVPPLPVPEPAAPLAPDRLLQNPSIRLFVERARSSQPGFKLAPENAADVGELVRRLDGLPLAIELAAARLKLLPPHLLVKRLDDRLKLLAGGAQDLPERQQTMRSVIDWSYDLLPQEEQKLFARLGVFVDGFSLDAAEIVCTPEGDLDAFNGLGLLVENNLIRQDAPMGDQPRFSMLETIREYALERLEGNEEKDRIRQRHAVFFSGTAEQARRELFSSTSEEWLDRLEVDYGNFRAALEWSWTSPERHELGWRILLSLIWMWFRRGYLNEARQWYEKALEQTARLENNPLRAMIQIFAGLVAMWQSDLGAAVRLMDEGIRIYRAHGDPLELPVFLFNRGVLAVNQGDDETGLAVLNEALALFEQQGQEWFQAIVLLHLGNIASNRGDLPTAQAYMDRSYQLGKKIGDRWIYASAINNFGEIARLKGDYDMAEEHYLESRELFRAIRSLPDVARANHSLAWVRLFRKEYDQAQALFREALELHQQLGIKRGVAECIAGLAAVKAGEGELELAVRLFSFIHARFAALQAGLWPADRADIRRILDRLRSEMEQPGFDTAWKEGQSRTLSQALAAVR